MDGFCIGDRVEVWWNGGWYEGTLIGLPDASEDDVALPKLWKVMCDADKESGQVTTSTRIRPVVSLQSRNASKACAVGDLVVKSFQPGDLVEAMHTNGEWYPARIAKYTGNNIFEIAWADGATYDLLKVVSDIRLLQQADIGGRSPSQSGGSLRFRSSPSASLGASLRMSTPPRQQSVDVPVEVLRVGSYVTQTDSALSAFTRLTRSRDHSSCLKTVAGSQISPSSHYTMMGGVQRCQTPPTPPSRHRQATPVGAANVKPTTSYGLPVPVLAATGAVRTVLSPECGYRPRYVASSVAQTVSTFQPGDQIEAWHRDGKWYKASIVQHKGNKIYEIRWDDGAKYDLLKSCSEIRFVQQVQGLLSPQKPQNWPLSGASSPSLPSRATLDTGNKMVESRSDATSPQAASRQIKAKEVNTHDTPSSAISRSRSERRAEEEESYSRWTLEASLAKAERARMMQGVKRTFDFSGPRWMEDAARFGGSSMSVAGFYEGYNPNEKEPRFGGREFACFDEGDRAIPLNGGGSARGSPERSRQGCDVLERNFHEAMDALEQLRRPWPLNSSATAPLSASATGWIRLPSTETASGEPEPITSQVVLPESSEVDSRIPENRLASFGFELNPSEIAAPSSPPQPSSPAASILSPPAVPSSLQPTAKVEPRPDYALRAGGIIRKAAVDDSAHDLVREELAKLRSWYSTLGDRGASQETPHRFATNPVMAAG